jgi:hypothetical protein
MFIRARAVAVCLLAALSSPLASAQDTPARDAGAPWELLVGPFAIHWSRNSEHKHVYLLGIERNLSHKPWMSDQALWGFSAFSNSFGQPSAYLYYGYRWDSLFGHPNLYAKITAGLLYGYKEPYEDKVPFNHNGFSPAIIPAVGYRLSPMDAVQINMLGSAGLIFTYNRRF